MEAPLLYPYDKSGGDVADEEANVGRGVVVASSNNTSTLMTCLNGLNALSGIGLLSMPYALSEAGWLSLIPFLAISIVCYYTGLLLKRCMDADPNINTYPDIGEYAFGYKGKVVISLVMYLELYLVAVGFLILEAANLDKLWPNTKFEYGGALKLQGKELFTILAALCFLPTVWLKNLGLLGYVSAGGVFSCVLMVCSVLWAAVFDGVGFHRREKLLDMSGMPSALGLYFFCFCGHAVFPSLCASMKKKDRFTMVLLICFVLCTFNYAIMAISGYLMYGDHVKSQITLNLPVEKFSTKIAIYTVLLNPLTRYALILSPVATAIEDKLLPSSQHHGHTTSSFVIRTLLVTSTAVVALSLPFFAQVVSLIGSFMSITASVLFPCVCYIKIFHRRRKCTVEVCVLSVIIICGIFATVLGTYTSFREIIERL